MREAFAPPPPSPSQPNSDFISDENDIDQGLGRTEEKVNAEDRVPPECPPFLPFLLSLDPYTYVTLGYLIAIFISMQAKRPEEQEAIGNFLEVIATNIEYIAEQGFYLQELEQRRQAKIAEIEKTELRNEINELKQIVSELQDQILSSSSATSSSPETNEMDVNNTE